MANTKYAKGIFTPKNPAKYVGKGQILYRSSWELAFFSFCDNHPSVLQWASECVRIPYRNPLSGKNTTYVPDLFIVYQDANGQNHAELIEIKPSKETTMEAAKSRRDKLSVALNMAKWQAAQQWSAGNGIKFRVVTEKDLFAGTK
jgi:hypothetical protein